MGLLGNSRFNNGAVVSTAYHYVDPMEWLYQGDPVPSQTRWDIRVGKVFYDPGMG